MQRKKSNLGLSSCGSGRSVVRPLCKEDCIARPLSYHVAGGVDVNAISKRPPLPGKFDEADVIASGEVDIFTDPRMNRLDVVDYAQSEISQMQDEIAKTIGVK